MVLRILSLCFFLSIFSSEVDAQRFKNARSYFKQFQNQNRKIRVKNLKYLKASLRGDDERKVNKFREVVLTQLIDSKKTLERLGPYKEDDILKKEYVASLGIYIKAFEDDFGIADELRKNQYRSFADLKKYYEAVEKAEDEMLEAAYRMEKAEDYFANKHTLNLVRDEEMETQFEMLDEVTLYTRDMTLCFFRIDAQAQNYIGAASRNNTDSLSMFFDEMRIGLKESKADLEIYADFDGKKQLYNALSDYLQEVEDYLNTTLSEVTEALENEFLDEDEYEDALKELKRFVKWRNYWVEDFFETKSALILKYLPES